MKHSHDIAILDRILAKGLCSGPGNGKNTFCAEQAVAVICGLPVTDRPDECVTPAVSSYGRAWNDRFRGSEIDRAKLMRDFLLAQIGSKGVVDGKAFATLLAIRTINQVLPLWLRNAKIDEALVVACENAKTLDEAGKAARAARTAADADAAYADAAAVYAAAAAADAAYADADAVYAAYADADAVYAAADDTYAAYAAYAAALRFKAMTLSISIAVEILRELKSPGCELLVPQ